MRLSDLSLGISPCPNDTFAFHALLHQLLEMKQMPSALIIDDIEKLNKLSLRHTLDISKISFAAYPFIADHYQILSSGAALGRGVGPLLVCAKEKLDLLKNGIGQHLKIGIPGEHTTANFLLKHFYKDCTTVELLFSDVAKAIKNESVDAGLLIHEGRFTYEKEGLALIADLGTKWEEAYQMPIPLGAIVVKRILPYELKLLIAHQLRESIFFARNNPQASASFVSAYAQEMSESVRQQHIDLYVNEHTLQLAETDKQAILKLLNAHQQQNNLPNFGPDIFIG
ncbi:MAG: 1,4-dihydroxy-6-naphtoate synthase [Bacteroidota bacterium]|jgi:1,4-dihydroxy-6-naphthoate synthase